MFKNILTKSKSLDSQIGRPSHFKYYTELTAIKEENAELKAQNVEIKAQLMNMTSNNNLFDVNFDQNLSKYIDLKKFQNEKILNLNKRK